MVFVVTTYYVKGVGGGSVEILLSNVVLSEFWQIPKMYNFVMAFVVTTYSVKEVLKSV